MRWHVMMSHTAAAAAMISTEKEHPVAPGGGEQSERVSHLGSSSLRCAHVEDRGHERRTRAACSVKHDVSGRAVQMSKGSRGHG